ncbi:DNA mismatch repair protein MutS, partial [Tyzzerella sp. OttesenSCG-928-J15]|nr:DNA mismatch repair protein MutS [Tyzzerella sp. OttesenSCG-928-J15]
VLGIAGGFVCASKLKLPNVGIGTSMRIYDDLSEGVSTFYAELERVKIIIDICKQEKMLFLIDEVFRGTNSNDRLEGAHSVLKSLDEAGAIGLITTHDLALCDMADNKRILNYSFNELYENNEIIFNYKLTEGKSTTTNAKFLMEKLGIIE